MLNFSVISIIRQSMASWAKYYQIILSIVKTIIILMVRCKKCRFLIPTTHFTMKDPFLSIFPRAIFTHRNIIFIKTNEIRTIFTWFKLWSIGMLFHFFYGLSVMFSSPEWIIKTMSVTTCHTAMLCNSLSYITGRAVKFFTASLTFKSSAFFRSANLH